MRITKIIPFENYTGETKDDVYSSYYLGTALAFVRLKK